MPEKPIQLLFAGDFNPASDESIEISDELKNILKNNDFSIINLETPLTLVNEPIIKTGRNFKKDPKLIRVIKDANFDAVTLSNNHIRDHGDKGVESTIQTCLDNGIKTVGAGKNIEEARKPLLIEIRGKKICFLNYSEIEFNAADDEQGGANPYNCIDAFYDIKKFKSDVDYIFIIYHGGLENHELPSPNVVQNIRYLIDVGADAAIIHHSHFYSGYQYYNNKPIIWGVGNFLSETSVKKPKKKWFYGLLAKFVIEDNRIDLKLVSIKQSKQFNKIELCNGDEEKEINNDIVNISKKILDNKQYCDYWNAVLIQQKHNLIKFIQAGSLLEFKIIKHLRFLNKKISLFKLKKCLNILRCDSHRYKFISVLNHEIKECVQVKKVIKR